MNPNDTTTPRTDSMTIQDKFGPTLVSVTFARQLERELTEAKAEVERLQTALEDLVLSIHQRKYPTPESHKQ